MKINVNFLGSRIKELREGLNISQTELAKKVGYSDSTTISKIEAGKKGISSKKIELIANVLNTTPGYLMGWNDLKNVDDHVDISFLTTEQKIELDMIISINQGLFMKNSKKISENHFDKLKNLLTEIYVSTIEKEE